MKMNYEVSNNYSNIVVGNTDHLEKKMEQITLEEKQPSVLKSPSNSIPLKNIEDHEVIIKSSVGKENVIRSTDIDDELLEAKIKDIIHHGGNEGLYFLNDEEKNQKDNFMNTFRKICLNLQLTVTPISNLTANSVLNSGNKESASIDMGKFQPVSSTTSNSSSSSILSEMKKTTDLPIYLIRKSESKDFIEIRVAVIGNVDAGKSTLLGVLTKGILDDGRGRARVGLLRHKHELESGRTSSVGNEILGFNCVGQRIETVDSRGKKIDWDHICEVSSKIISFMDLAGHEKYLKTTMFGLTGYAPDYALLMVGSNAGLIGMAKEHLALTFALNIPVIIVITKIDMTPSNIAEENLRYLIKLLKSPQCQRTPIVVHNSQDSLSIMKNFLCERYVPIFQISNLSGKGIPLLSQFLNMIPSRMAMHLGQLDPHYIEYQITETYDVHGVGTVVAGTLTSGCVSPGQILYLGPDGNGSFIETHVKSIQRKRLNVDVAYASQSVTFALKKISRSQIKKGMVLVSREPMGTSSFSYKGGGGGGCKGTQKKNQSYQYHHHSLISNSSTLSQCLPSSQLTIGTPIGPSIAVVWEFSAEVLILFHATTITLNYQAMLHCGVIRQTISLVKVEELVRSNQSKKSSAKISSPPHKINDLSTSTSYSSTRSTPLSSSVSSTPSSSYIPSAAFPSKGLEKEKMDILRTGDRAVVRFRFLKKPEYLRTGMRLLFREGKTKGVGKVIRLYPE